jgi:hypothetical protein
MVKAEMKTVPPVLPLLIGLVVGGAGAVLFSDSLPGRAGSPEERANKLEVALQRAQNRIAELEAKLGGVKHGGLLAKLSGADETGHRALSDATRRIAEDIRAGRAVNPDEVFRLCQPLMRDLAPLFDRMRIKSQRQIIDSMTGELARKYKLTAAEQASLTGWFQKKSEEDAKKWSEMVGREGTRLEDVMRASQEVRPDEGLDAFMPAVLSGDRLAAFKTERMAERASRVEQEADMKVQRLDAVVKLDETQRDQIFAVMARGSRDYDPTMKLEGANGPVGSTTGGDPREAMLLLLRPDQRAAYEAERQRRTDNAAKEMEGLGLALPKGWDVWDDLH